MRLPMNTSLATLKPSGIRRINALAAQHPGCIALALGEPDFPTPDVISAEVTASLDRGDTHYPPNNGRLSCARHCPHIWATRVFRFRLTRSS